MPFHWLIQRLMTCWSWSSSYIVIHIEIENEDQFRAKLYDKDVNSIFPLWIFLLYVALFQQNLEYIYRNWYAIPEHIYPIMNHGFLPGEDTKGVIRSHKPKENNAMAKSKTEPRVKQWSKTLYRKLKIERDEPNRKPGVNTGTPER